MKTLKFARLVPTLILVAAPFAANLAAPLLTPLARPVASSVASSVASAPAWWTPTTLHAQELTRAQIEQIDEIFETWSSADGPGAAVAVTRNGRTIFSQGYGSAQLEYRIPVTPTTPFHIASISKQFTTFAIALLARDGHLTWDDDVRLHLPEVQDLGHTVTLRHLAMHTSGVRDQWQLLQMAGWRMDDVITRDQVMALMSRQRELNFEPGAEYLYSNMGYSLLAEVVERVSGQSFGAFLEERVFIPLGMLRTHVHLDHTRVVPGRAYSYRPAQGEWRHAVLSYANQGATSLFTTVEDLARWIGEFENPRVGDPALWAEMRQRGVLNSGDSIAYGLGLSIGTHRGLRTVGHGGSDAGFRTNLLHFPDEGLGVVVFGNSSSFNAGPVAQRVAAVFLDDRMRPVAQGGGGGGGGGGQGQGNQPDPEPARPLAEYQGVFYSPELETWYRITLEEGALVVHHPRHPNARLLARGGDEFVSTASFLRNITFTSGPDGALDGFRVTAGRVRNLRFVRLSEGAIPGG
jgi:CubicO group peptidase (beta-lactamase class C family)